MKMTLSPAGRIAGELRPPSNKSLTHRAYIFGAMASVGRTSVTNALDSEDCLATLRIMEQLGARFSHGGGTVHIDPPGRLRQPSAELDCGNSGTTMRLLAGVLASAEGLETVLVGDESLSRRPMGRIVEPLRLMGAQIEGETAPLNISGRRLHGIEHTSPVASAQIKSCLLMAGLSADGETWVTEPARSRDHTERMLRSLGIEVMARGDLTVGVRGGGGWEGFSFNVPGDISSAAYFMAAAAMLPGSDVTLRDVGTNPTRTGIIDALRSTGAQVEIENEHDEQGEPSADIRVRGMHALRPFDVRGDLVPRLIDEIPVLAVAATRCDGTSSFREARELRVKETDRVETVAEGLRAMGARVETFDDGLEVHGPVKLRGAEIDSVGDHRVGMAFAVAGLVATGVTVIHNTDAIRTSYPEFERDLSSLARR